MENAAQSAPQSYHPVAQIFHWGIALGILCLFLLAAAMEGPWSQDVTRAIYTSHKTIGILVLGATFLRLFWRLTHGVPSLAPLHLKVWEEKLSTFVHHALYLFSFLVPLSGWVMASMGPYGVKLFGLYPIPSLPVAGLVANDPALASMIGEMHGTLASILFVLLGLHVGGALKHHFIDKNDLLLRMMPRAVFAPLEKLRRIGR